MFNYTNTVILNSLVDAQTGAAKVSYEDKVNGQESYGKVLRVRRVNDYKVEGIKGGVVYKKTASAGVKEIAELDVASLTLDAGTKIRLVVNVFKKNSANSDYSSAGNRLLVKPFYLELTCSTRVTTIAERTALINKIKSYVQANQSRFDNARFEIGQYTAGDVENPATFNTGATLTGTKIGFRALDDRDQFVVLDIEKYVGTTAFGGFESAINSSVVTPVVAGKEAVGTYDVMVRNTQIQTAERTGFLAQGKDEQVIPGATYNQYTFDYQVESEVTGMGTVGQVMTTSTTHVFWVKSDIVEGFEAELGVGKANVTITEI